MLHRQPGLFDFSYVVGSKRMFNKFTKFKQECDAEISIQGSDAALAKITRTWFDQAQRFKYSYHFEWLGRPIIQYPQDVAAMQEIIWAVRPDLIIETGIAHGGSLIFSASMLALLDYCDAMESGDTLDPAKSKREVVGVDIDIRSHNRAAIEAHPMSQGVTMIEGSSIDAAVVARVHEIAARHKNVLVCLDSNHTHDHVLRELEAYAPLVTPGSYCVVFDTVIEDMLDDEFSDRPWGPGDNPKTAVHQYLKDNPVFEIDKQIDHKLLISVAPDGYLRRKS